MNDKKMLKIGVFRGGVSTEREVSLESGAAVLASLKSSGYEVCDCVINKSNKEYISEILKNNKINFVFNVLHGAFGEDGKLQEILDEQNLGYNGSGAKASSLAMDKALTHQVLFGADIKMPKYKIFTKTKFNPEDLCGLEYPIVIKPSDGGSSVGVYIVETQERLKEVVQTINFENVMAEECISGREFTVGIIGEDVLPIIEIVSPNKFYDYEAKYKMETKFEVPAKISKEVEVKMKSIALKVFNALGCSVVGRVDMIMDSAGEVYVLELNSLPGMTSHSLLPLAASKIGLSFNDLCVKIIQLSLIK